MHLKTLRAKRDLEARHNQDLAKTPRAIAIEWLQLKVEEGKLALDPFDPSIAVLDAGPNERLWGYRSLELCGFVESRYDQPEGRQRITACLEADVRMTLGLLPPLRLAEELAGTSITDLPAFEAPTALRRAKQAYDKACPTCRGTGGGVYNDCPTCDGNGAVA